MLKELNVMGAIQLFAACQKAPSVRRVILKSTSEVYGSSSRDPVLFTESSSRRRPPGEGFARDSIDIEATPAAWDGAGPTSPSRSCGWPT